MLAGRGAAPFSDPYPLWFDYDEEARQQIHNSVFDVGCFRVFHLHRAEVSLPEYPGQAKECICTPRGPGHTGLFRLSTPERPLPRAKNVATCLKFSPPSDDHWALTMDQVFDSALAQLAQNRLDKESVAAMAALEEDADPPSRSGKGRPLPRSSKGKHPPPEPLPNLGGAASMSGVTPKLPDETLQKTKKVLNSLRDLQLRMVFDIGGMKVVDQQLTDFLIVDFLRLQTMLGKDLIHNIKSYHTKILKAATVLEEDLAGYLRDSVSPAIEQWVRSSMRRFKNNCTTYCLLPEAEFDCTRLEVDEFLMSRLCETVSQKGSKTLMEKLAERVSLSQGRVWQLMESPEMSNPEVVGWVSTAISATQPYLSVTFRGSFEGLLGQLGLSLADGSPPPLSQREGYITRFAEAISKLFRDRGVAFDDDWVDQVIRHWHHRDEFKERYASKAPAGVGGAFLPELLQFLDHLHRQEMENLEQDLDFGEPVGAEIWESFKEDEIPHPRNLLEQMWWLVQQNVHVQTDPTPEDEEDNPEPPDNPNDGEDANPPKGGPGGGNPPGRSGTPGTPAAPGGTPAGPLGEAGEQQLLGMEEEDIVETGQQPPSSGQQLVIAPAGASKPIPDPFVSLPPM